jgi:hypothetical protein
MLPAIHCSVLIKTRWPWTQWIQGNETRLHAGQGAKPNYEAGESGQVRLGGRAAALDSEFGLTSRFPQTGRAVISSVLGLVSRFRKEDVARGKLPQAPL